MSNYLYTGSIQFAIPPEKEGAARQALSILTLEEIDTGSSREQEIKEYKAECKQRGEPSKIVEWDLDDLISVWGWCLDRDERDGPVTGIFFEEDYSSTEEELFTTLAPFVTAGSFIEFDDKENQYRYAFTGIRMIEQEAVYPAIPIEVE